MYIKIAGCMADFISYLSYWMIVNVKDNHHCNWWVLCDIGYCNLSRSDCWWEYSSGIVRLFNLLNGVGKNLLAAGLPWGHQGMYVKLKSCWLIIFVRILDLAVGRACSNSWRKCQAIEDDKWWWQIWLIQWFDAATFWILLWSQLQSSSGWNDLRKNIKFS